jgi:hypothetical protein
LCVDAGLGPVISWKQDLKGRWQLIIEHAWKRHNELAVAELRSINKDIITTSIDRNIVVHGLVHAKLSIPNNLARGATISGGTVPIYPMTAPPCWTIFKGEGKGKSFPISTEAVTIIIDNINKIAERVAAFNLCHNYHEASIPSSTVEQSWPKKLP